MFRTDREVLEAVLPPVLKPLGSRSLAVVRVMRHARARSGRTSACTSVRPRCSTISPCSTCSVD